MVAGKIRSFNKTYRFAKDVNPVNPSGLMMEIMLPVKSLHEKKKKMGLETGRIGCSRGA